MKKIISASIAILMALVCTACSENSTESDTDSDHSSDISSIQQTTSLQVDDDTSTLSDVTQSTLEEGSGIASVSDEVSSSTEGSSETEVISESVTSNSEPLASINSKSDSAQNIENSKGLIAAFLLNQGSGNKIIAQNDEGFISSPIIMSKDDKILVRWDKDAKMGNYMNFLRFESAANFYAGGLVQVKSKPMVIGSKNAPFSISAWVNPSEYHDDGIRSHDFRIIFAKATNETLAHWDFKLLRDNRLSFHAHAMAYKDRKDSPYVVPNNKWTHVMVACTGKRMIYYANGKEVYAYDLTSDYNIVSEPAGPYTIGCLIENLYGFRGGIAEVKIYNQAVKPEDTTDIPFD